MPITDDSRRKTRVYHRKQEQQQEHSRNEHDERIGFTQPIAPQHRALDGISAAQVLAGAAAAATSMLLASKIGIAGSVIGAAVSSAVTIICSQLYRHALETSAEKLKLSQLGLAGSSERLPAADAYRPSKASAAYRSTRIAPAALQIRAAEERRSTQRKVLVASVALAAAAVALTAGIILLGTAGQGLGTRPAPLLPVAPQQQQPATGQDNEAAPNTEPDTGNESNPPTDASDNADADKTEENNGTDGSQKPTDNEGTPTPDEPTGEEPSGNETTDPDGNIGTDSTSSETQSDDATAGSTSGTAGSPSSDKQSLTTD